jgi:hypothetical protein
MNRRTFLKYLGAGSAVLVWPAGCARAGSVLSASERKTLAAIADGILPPDDQPGGAALGAVAYIEALLGALDGKTPTVLRGGPYSERQPFADASGAPSTMFPPDGFVDAAPLDRVALRAWQLRLYGSSGVHGGGPNDAVLGPVVGLRDQIHQGLKSAEGLDFSIVDSDFIQLLYPLVCEAAFGAPEYGGNPGGAGWAMVHFEGDQQPFGFSQLDQATMTYVERADAPVTTANPGADPEPLDSATEKLLDTVIAALGGKRFP